MTKRRTRDRSNVKLLQVEIDTEMYKAVKREAIDKDTHPWHVVEQALYAWFQKTD